MVCYSEEQLKYIIEKEKQSDTRGTVYLDKAREAVYKDRQEVYGSPENNLRDIADFWTTYLRRKLSADVVIDVKDVAHMMSLLKISREMAVTKEDNRVDIIGWQEALGLAEKGRR